MGSANVFDVLRASSWYSVFVVPCETWLGVGLHVEA